MEKEFEAKLKYFNLDVKTCSEPGKEDGVFNVLRQDIDWSGKMLNEIPFDKIGFVEGNFDISKNNIKSFNGSPKEIIGLPNFSYNIELNSLDYAPRLKTDKYSSSDAFDWLLKQMGIEEISQEWTKLNMSRLTGDDDKMDISYLKQCFKGTEIDEDMITIYHYANKYKTWLSSLSFKQNIEFLYRKFLQDCFDLSLIKKNKYFPRIDGTVLANDLGI